MKNTVSYSICTISLVLFSFLTNFSSAQSSIEFSGTIDSDTTWSADTVRVTGGITILDDITLTIDQGTLVEFQGWYEITVEGTIIADGAPGDSIVFTCHPDSTASGWDGFYIMDPLGTMLDNDSSKFNCCVFEYANEKEHGTTADGGGVFFIHGLSRLSIANSRFSTNRSSVFGGCISLRDQADISIENCIFYGNDATQGSAIYTYNSDPLVRNNKFLDNTNRCIYLTYGSKAVFINNFFGKSDDSAIGCYFSNPVISGNIIVNNFRGIYLDQSNPVIINNTICNNDQGLYCTMNSNPRLFNNILWGNSLAAYLSQADIKPDFYYCNIEGGPGNFGGSGSPGDYENNIDADPGFSSPSAGAGPANYDPDSDWAIMLGSPSMNSGSPDISGLVLAETDILGSPRELYTRIDQGAIEYQMDTITVCGEISSDTTFYNDTILVACNTTILGNGTLNILPGTVVEFRGHYTLTVEGRILAIGSQEDTILFTRRDTLGYHDMDTSLGGWGGIFFNDPQSDADSSILRFCKFEHGKAVLDGFPSEYGGAVRCQEFSKLKLENCSFINNSARSSGGAVYLWLSDAHIKNCYFEGNRSGFAGGAVAFNAVKSGFMDNCVFYKNLARLDGGGLLLSSCTDLTIMNNVISHNSAESGGGIRIFQSEDNLVINNIISNNSATRWRSGGIDLEMTTGFLFVNNTITNNSSTQYGGGIALSNCEPVFYNTIFHGNIPDQIRIRDMKGQPDIHFSNIQGGPEELTGVEFNGAWMNNIDSEPYFVNPSSGPGTDFGGLFSDWSLLPVSPCIDKGTSSIDNLEIPEKDVYGREREFSRSVDIGAAENHSGPPIITLQPQNYIRCEGDSLAFSLRTPELAFFRWQKDGIDIPGATGNNYIIDTLNSADEGNYQCLVGNAYDTVFSTNVFLGVRVPPEILYQSHDQWVEESKQVSLSVFARGTNLEYLWAKNDSVIDDAVSPELVFTDPRYSDEGSYKCIISNLCGIDSSDLIRFNLAPQICMVTVSPTTGNNLVVWEKKTSAPIMAYNIYRESIAAGIYDILETIPYDELSVFVDTTADPTVQAYLYKITAIDSAGNETDIDLCRPHKTIHLIVSTNPELNSTQLQWYRYYGFDYQTYTIYRSSTGMNFDPVHSLSASLNSWTDPEPSDGDLFYRIAVEKPTPCVPEGAGKKAGTGPYIHSLSNLDDNKLRAGENPPDTLKINNNSVHENNFFGDLIGRLITVDKDSFDIHTYQFVSGPGDDHNTMFTILGDLLLAASKFDFEVQSQLSVRIRSTDQSGNFIETSLIISILDVDETVGIQDYNNATLSISPNPFRNSAMVRFPNPEGHAYRMFITDLTGKRCMVQEQINTSEFFLNKKALDKGVYFIELRGAKTFRARFVID